MHSIHSKILGRIYGHGRGWVFTQKDFSDLGSRQAIDVSLHRLCRGEKIRCICRGIYGYPEYSEFLGKYISPDFGMVSDAISRKYGWRTCPNGETALNILGMSTQLPAKIVYLSDGPTKNFKIGNQVISFKNTSLRDLQIKNRMSAIVVQALKSLGAEHIEKEIIGKFRKRLKGTDKKKLLKESKYLADWIYEAIKKICDGDENG